MITTDLPSQDPLRTIMPQRTANCGKLGSSDGMARQMRNPSARSPSAEGRRRCVVRERVTPVWWLSTLSSSLLSRTVAFDM